MVLWPSGHVMGLGSEAMKVNYEENNWGFFFA